MSAAAAGASVSKAAAPTMRLRMARTGRRRSPLVSALRYGVVGLALIFFLFPIYWIAGTSIKYPGEFLSNPPVWIPSEVTFVHYQSVMADKGSLALRNS
ncbi:MAG: transporter substrate-binding protein, partial [Thermomicrobiales bacterium]|nr:transporter substrate-binding protein [Thermomicrobiales bacterium]